MAKPTVDLYRLVADGRLDRRADTQLTNWANWMRRYEVGKGYGHATPGIKGYGSNTFDDMAQKADNFDARVSNACIESLSMIHQCAVHNAYLADVWRHRGDPVEVFLEAVRLFWDMAQRRGLT